MKPSEPEWGSQALVDELRRRGAELTNVEVKSGAGGVPSSLLDTLSAFSNGRGGTILLGLDDSFTAVPIDAEALRDGLAGMAADRMSPPVRGDIESYDVLRTRLTPREGRTDLR